MYNPENLELPDRDDPTLTDYVWEHGVGSFIHVIGVNSEKWELEDSPEVDLEFSPPFKYKADFHLVTWPECSYDPLPDISFDFVELDRSNPNSSSVRSEIAGLLEVSEDLLDSWCERANASNFDKLFIQRWGNVRYEWPVRGFRGLTLGGLKQSLEIIDLWKDFVLSEDEEVAEILESFETFKSNYVEFERLRFGDAELGANVSMGMYRESPTDELALECARYLHIFGGAELASFHFPNLDLCGSCGEPAHSGSAANCESRLSYVRF